MDDERIRELVGADLADRASGLGFVLLKCRLAHGGVEMDFGHDGRTVTVWVKDRDEEGAFYRSTDRFVLGYRAGAGVEEVTRLVDLVAKGVREREHGWSGDLGGRKERGLKLLGARLELRITTACNEKCPFCNTDENAENVVTSAREIVAAIEGAPAMGAASVVFTGGEPTLRKELPRWISLAKAKGLDTWVQTNGLSMGCESYWKDLEARGALPDYVHVSFHTSRPDRLRAVTGRGGTMSLKVGAVRHALDRGIGVYLCFVVSTLNQDEIADFPAFVHKTFGTAPVLQLSVVAPTGRAAGKPGLMPRYSEIAPKMASALDSAVDLGLDVFALEACGIPMCFLPDHLQAFETFERLRQGYERHMPDKTWTSACSRCRARDVCLGVWREYLALYGEDEFDPL